MRAGLVHELGAREAVGAVAVFLAEDAAQLLQHDAVVDEAVVALGPRHTHAVLTDRAAVDTGQIAARLRAARAGARARARAASTVAPRRRSLRRARRFAAVPRRSGIIRRARLRSR